LHIEHLIAREKKGMSEEDLSKLRIDKAAGSYQRRKRRQPLYALAVILLLVLLGVLYLNGVFTPAVEIEVSNVTQIYPSQTFTLLNASGYVVAQRKAAVASKVTGRLISIGVEEGSRVRKGEVIARLENDDVSAARAQAEARLKAAEHNLELAEAELVDAQLSFERIKDLFEREYVPKASFDTAEARYKKSVAAVESAKAEVDVGSAALRGAEVAVAYTLIRAPFDAVVLTKNADIGDIVTPIGAAAEAKAAVVTIADMASLQVESDVSESNLRQVKIGQPCEIQLDAIPDLRFRGEVHMIVPTADRTKATVMVKVRFVDKDPRILPEMSAKVAFLEREIGQEEQSPLDAVNSEAVVVQNGKEVVFLIDGERVARTPVRKGQTLNGMTEILSGVKAGDRVVLNPPPKMKDGSRIRIKEK
jgi:RND family efflux transporter MFP subunit